MGGRLLSPPTSATPLYQPLAPHLKFMAAASLSPSGQLDCVGVPSTLHILNSSSACKDEWVGWVGGMHAVGGWLGRMHMHVHVRIHVHGHMGGWGWG